MCYKGGEQEEEATKSYCDQIVLATHTTPVKLCGCNIYIFGDTGAYTDKQTDLVLILNLYNFANASFCLLHSPSDNQEHGFF